MTADQTLIRRLLVRRHRAVRSAPRRCPRRAQADYPNKPVRMLIGFPPGQATDTLGRAIAQKLSQQLGQQFVVENKPGAAGIIATQAAMSSPADGYTLLVSSSGPLAVNPGLVHEAALRPDQGFRAGRRHRDRAAGAGDQSVLSGDEREGAGCSCQGKAEARSTTHRAAAASPTTW